MVEPLAAGPGQAVPTLCPHCPPTAQGTGREVGCGCSEPALTPSPDSALSSALAHAVSRPVCHHARAGVPAPETQRWPFLMSALGVFGLLQAAQLCLLNLAFRLLNLGGGANPGKPPGLSEAGSMRSGACCGHRPRHTVASPSGTALPGSIVPGRAVGSLVNSFFRQGLTEHLLSASHWRHSDGAKHLRK